MNETEIFIHLNAKIHFLRGWQTSGWHDRWLLVDKRGDFSWTLLMTSRVHKKSSFWVNALVGRKAFLFFCFLCQLLFWKNLFLCKQILFLLRQLFLCVQSQNKSCFFTIKTFFYVMHTWHLLFDKLSHNDKGVSYIFWFFSQLQSERTIYIFKYLIKINWSMYLAGALKW